MFSSQQLQSVHGLLAYFTVAQVRISTEFQMSNQNLYFPDKTTHQQKTELASVSEKNYFTKLF